MSNGPENAIGHQGPAAPGELSFAANAICPLRGGYTPYSMSDVLAASSAKRFNAVVLFAGGGGSSIGIKLAGGDVRLVNEFVSEAARTHSTNFPDIVIDRHDIREIIGPKEGVIRFLFLGGLAPGEIDLLQGSPPCAAYSSAGRGMSDPNRVKTYSDVKQAGVGTLIFDLVDFVHHAHPKVVVIENVPAFAQRYGHVLRDALVALCFKDGERRYFAKHEILAADDFGTPQARERLFVVGIRVDVGDQVDIRSDEDVARVFPRGDHRVVTVRAAFERLKQSDADIEPWRRAMMSRPLARYVRMLPRDRYKWTRPRNAGLDPRTRFTLVRAAWDLPAPTLTAAGQQTTAYTGVIHPEEDRLFTLPEQKRLMGLPDDFALTGTLDQASERVGRMVAPFVMRALAASIYETVLAPYNGKEK